MTPGFVGGCLFANLCKNKKAETMKIVSAFGEPSGIFPLRGGACPPPTAVPDGAPSSRPGVPPAPPASLRPFRVRIPAFSSAKNNGDGKNHLRYLVNHRGFFRSAEALVHRLRRCRTARPLRGRACHRHPQLRSDPFGFEPPLFLPHQITETVKTVSVIW